MFFSSINTRPALSLTLVFCITFLMAGCSTVLFNKEQSTTQLGSAKLESDKQILLQQKHMFAEAETKLLETVRTIHSRVELSNEQLASDAAEPQIPSPIPDEIADKSVEPSVWDTIRDGYALPDANHERVEKELARYLKRPDLLVKQLEEAGPFLYYVTKQVTEKSLPMELALLPYVESHYRPFAYSHGSAAGIWQFIPSTARGYGMKINWWYDERRDVISATHHALGYLERLNKRFKGDWLLAIGSYNAGGGRVNQAMTKCKKRHTDCDFWDLKLPLETRLYVPRLIALSKIIGSPDSYNIELPNISTEDPLVAATVPTQIDLALAAEYAGLTMEQFYELNPGFNQWATDPAGPHRFLLPQSAATRFEEALNASNPEERLQWQRYTVKSGDSLIRIGKKFNISPSLIKEVNQLSGHFIKAGDALLIPQASKSQSYYSLSETIRKQKRNQKQSHLSEYKVVSGDSLWTIARRFDTSVKALRSINKIGYADSLSIGQRIKIPGTVTKPSSGLSKTQKQQLVRYKVRKGDSLARIAQKFGVRIAQLETWNKIKRSKYLQPSQVIKVYVDVTRQHLLKRS